MDLFSKLRELKKFRLSDLFVKEKIKNYINYEKELAHNPRKLASSFALGVFVGLSVPMGLQTVAGLPLAILFRCNILVVYLASLITNPFTAIFIYTGMFKIGELVTGNHIPYEQLEVILNNFTFKQFSQLGSIVLYNYLFGMVVLVITLTPLSYYLVLLYLNRRKIFLVKKKHK